VNTCTLIRAGLLVSTTLLVGCETTSTRNNPETTQMKSEFVFASHAEMRVDGLGCPMCAESISILLGNIDAVQDSRVDLSTGTVSVDLDPSVAASPAELRSAIDDGGFTFRSISFTE
jgi:copper chaperone CopZ